MSASDTSMDNLWRTMFRNALTEPDDEKRESHLRQCYQAAARHNIVFEIASTHKHAAEVKDLFAGYAGGKKYLAFTGDAMSPHDYLVAAQASMAARGLTPK